jgi:hypothetical protein
LYYVIDFSIQMGIDAKIKSDSTTNNQNELRRDRRTHMGSNTPGDVLFFYMSKDESYAATQSITTIGIAEQVINVSTVDDLVRHTAKRSVFSADGRQRG